MAEVVDDEEEEMADLFSFGSEEAAANVSSSVDPQSSSTSSPAHSSPDSVHRPARQESNDSFLDLLATENTASSILEGSASGAAAEHDKETQEILDWLEEDGNEEAIIFGDSLESPKEQQPETEAAVSQTPPATPAPTVVALPPVFTTLTEALESPESTTEQVRQLYGKEQKIDTSLRADLYCRMVCGKTLKDTQSSSLADSFDQWQPTTEDDSTTTGWVQQQAEQLSPRIASETGRDATECQQDLTKLLLYYQHEKQASETKQQPDLLLPPVATAVLSAGIPVNAASVVLSQLVPNFMPILALQPNERWEAALLLHKQFYLLACYHVPLLVYHLDRYWPGWHWPKLPESVDTTDITATQVARNLQKQGQLPPSWLLSLASGECGGSLLPASWILRLWDGMLTNQNDASMRFFLTLAALEQSSDQLLLLTGDELVKELQAVFTLENKKDDWMDEWWSRAQSLQASTPETVVAKLCKAEDEAVQQSLQRRQERAEAELKARLEAEAAAHKEAQDRKAEEARTRLTRARLVAYYRKHAPEKEGNIDKIMKTYAERFGELDGKLKKKYGEGFNPATKSKPASKGTNKLLATMNQGLGNRRKVEEEEKVEEDTGAESDTVCVTVSAAEVLPVICWSRESAAERSHLRRNRVKETGRAPLKFYLVDSRSEEAAQEQGRFPTAVSLSPEAMLDPERIQQNEDMFESLRGAVHIVVMGEGFSALPDLYGQKLSPKLKEPMRQDESRTNICALFFVKKGFPFVSVLDGGFAAAHSWLVREGPENHFRASDILVDYDPDASLFGQMETLHNASATEKAQIRMQNLLESSLVTLTRRAQQMERLASDLDRKEGRGSLRLNFFGGGKDETEAKEVDQLTLEDEANAVTKENISEQTPKAGQAPTPEAPAKATPFRNPFARIGQSPQSENRKQLDSSADKKEDSSTDGHDGIVADTDSGTPAATGEKASIESSPVADTGPAQPPQASASNRFSRFGLGGGKPKDENPDSLEAKPGNNPFKGFHMGLNMNKNATEQTAGPKAPAIPDVLKRNPFRFGGGSGKPPARAPAENNRIGGGLTGLNNLGRSTLSRMRSSTSRDGDSDTADESITFNTPDIDQQLTT